MEVCLASRELSYWLKRPMESYSLEKTETKTNKETAHKGTQGTHLCLFTCLSPARRSASVTSHMPKGRMVCPRYRGPGSGGDVRIPQVRL